jgi:hypothetical protein
LASWEVRFLDADTPNKVYTGRFMAENLTYEIINSDDGGITCELPLSATQTDQPTVGIIRDSFAPKRSHWELWRTGSSGTAKE